MYARVYTWDNRRRRGSAIAADGYAYYINESAIEGKPSEKAFKNLIIWVHSTRRGRPFNHITKAAYVICDKIWVWKNMPERLTLVQQVAQELGLSLLYEEVTAERNARVLLVFEAKQGTIERALSEVRVS